MPVKRRVSKRNDAHVYKAWSAIFDCGDDFFDNLKDIGIPLQRSGQPFDADALAAWERYGARWLDQRTRTEKSWAEDKFGRPWEISNAS